MMSTKISVTKISKLRGTWVAQWVKHLTLDFISGHDLRAVRSIPKSVSALGMEPA